MAHTRKRYQPPIDKDGRKRTVRIPGTVDFYYATKHPVCWRRLQSVTNPSHTLDIFGYCSFPPNGGPWFGWSKENIEQAPCNHCGAIHVFNGTDNWKHRCPGKSNGVILPCLEAHDCEGQPSMSHHDCARFVPDDWREIRIES